MLSGAKHLARRGTPQILRRGVYPERSRWAPQNDRLEVFLDALNLLSNKILEVKPAMIYPWLKSPKSLLTSGFALALIFILACGTAAPPEAAEPANPPPASAGEPAAAPAEEVEKEISKEITSNVAVTPTPVPVASAETVEAKVERVIYALGEVVETNRH
jgi:hypothetical protein